MATLDDQGLPIPDPAYPQITDDLQKNRPGHLGGTVTGLAHPYMWGSGGMRGAPSIPYGSSPIGGAHNGPVMRGLVNRGVIPDQGLELPGFQSIHDPQRNGGGAPGLVLHAWSGDDLDRLYSLGCFTVPKTQWAGFRQDLLDYQKANNGNAYLNITPTGEAKITSAPIYGANGAAPPAAAPVPAIPSQANLAQNGAISGGQSTMPPPMALGGPPPAATPQSAPAKPTFSTALRSSSSMPYDATGNYVPEDVIAQQYKLADALRQQPQATSWAGVAANALGGLGSGMLRSDAQGALKGNQAQMSSVLKNAGATVDPVQQRQIMTQSGIPAVQEAGLKIQDPMADYNTRAQAITKFAPSLPDADKNEFALTGKLPGDKFGMTGAIVMGPDNSFYSVQWGQNGARKIQKLELPGAPAAQGQPAVPPTPLQPSKGVKVVGDTVISNATGADVRNIAPALSGGERAKEVGQAQGKAAVNLPTVEANASRMISTIDSLMKDPGLDQVTGGILGRLPESMQSPQMATAQSKINEVLGGTFLTAYQDLRGGGQISDAEGKSAKAAYARLQTQTMDGKDYRQALQEFRTQVLKLTDIARIKAGEQPRFFNRNEITKLIDDAAKQEGGAPAAAGGKPVVPPGWAIETVSPSAPAVSP